MFLAVVCLDTQFGLESAAPIKVDVDFRLLKLSISICNWLYFNRISGFKECLV